MHMVNDRLLQKFIHLPDHRSRLIFDLDSTVVTVFGHQEHAAVGYNPRYRGKRSYNPLLCIEANSSYLWDTELRAGNASTWEGSPELLDTCFVNVPPDIREIRLRADSGFGFNPVLEALEQRSLHYAVVARMTSGLRRCLQSLHYHPVTAFQRNCLDTSWQNLTLSTLRYKLFLLPGELIRPQNRPVLRLRQSSLLQHLADDILRKIKRVRPLRS